MSVNELDAIVAGDRDAFPSDQFLDLMLERRQEFWESKPLAERTHYQGFDDAPDSVVFARLNIQCHAELWAGQVPYSMLLICPWIDIKADLAKQVHDEYVHFKLVRAHLESLGGHYPEDYSPPVREWKDLQSLAVSGDATQSPDVATQVVARSVMLQFAVEGWDVEYIHPHFMDHIKDHDPELHEIFDSQIITDERLHQEIGERIVRLCGSNRGLQKTAIESLDKALLYHHRANLGFRDWVTLGASEQTDESIPAPTTA